jgi:hypothetical protein
MDVGGQDATDSFEVRILPTRIEGLCVADKDWGDYMTRCSPGCRVTAKHSARGPRTGGSWGTLLQNCSGIPSGVIQQLEFTSCGSVKTCRVVSTIFFALDAKLWLSIRPYLTFRAPR